MKKLLLFTCVCTLLASCEQSFLSMKEKNFDLIITYEEETISFNESYDDAGNALEVNSIYAEPVIERNFVKICVNEDGSGEMTITQIEPENEFKPAPPPLPSKEKRAKTIKFMNGNIYTFDDNGNQLSVKAGEMPDFSVYLNFYLKNQIPDHYYALDDKRLKSTGEESIIKGDHETAYIKIFNPSDNVSENLMGKKSVVFVDNNTGLVNRSAIFNTDRTFNMASTYSYSENPQIPVPVFSKTETYTYTPEGQSDVFITITKNEEISITDNM